MRLGQLPCLVEHVWAGTQLTSTGVALWRVIYHLVFV